jgi:hypothetical protein
VTVGLLGVILESNNGSNHEVSLGLIKILITGLININPLTLDNNKNNMSHINIFNVILF